MCWKNKLTCFESNKKWDEAIEYMQVIVAENPCDVDAYLSMCYLLMNLLVEEDYDRSKHDYYAALAKKYFDESYAKFSDNPEYLFFMGITAFMPEWYFDLDIEQARDMIKKAAQFEPENILYRCGYYVYLDMSDIENRKNAVLCADAIRKDEKTREFIVSKGALGDYVLMMLVS